MKIKCLCLHVVLSLLDFNFSLLQDQIRTNDTLPDILDILDDSFEVRSGIVRAGDEDVVLLAGAGGRVERRDAYEPALC